MLYTCTYRTAIHSMGAMKMQRLNQECCILESPLVGFTLASLAHWWVCHASASTPHFWGILPQTPVQSQMGEYLKISIRYQGMSDLGCRGVREFRQLAHPLNNPRIGEGEGISIAIGATDE